MSYPQKSAIVPFRCTPILHIPLCSSFYSTCQLKLIAMKAESVHTGTGLIFLGVALKPIARCCILMMREGWATRCIMRCRSMFAMGADIVCDCGWKDRGCVLFLFLEELAKTKG